MNCLSTKTILLIGISFCYVIVGGVCNFLGSVSPQQKFEATDKLVLQPYAISSDAQVLQLYVTAHFYLESKGKYILEAWGQANPKDAKRRKAPSSILAPLFIRFFLLPLSLSYVNWASQESCLFYLGSSLWSSDFPLFYFLGLFPSLSFSHYHSGLIFPILTTWILTRPSRINTQKRCPFHYRNWNAKGGSQETPASWETYMQVRKQQLELDMEQQTGSK